MAEKKDPDQDAEDNVNVARRRLMKTAVYLPPAVIGIVALTQGCAPGSCSPITCNPNNGPCNPNTPCNPHP